MLKILYRKLLPGVSTPLAVPPEGVEALARSIHLSREDKVGLLLGLPSAHMVVGERIARRPWVEAQKLVKEAIRVGAEPAAAVAGGRLGIPVGEMLEDLSSAKALLAEEWWRHPPTHTHPPLALTSPLAVGLGLFTASLLPWREGVLLLGFFLTLPMHKGIVLMWEWAYGHILALRHLFPSHRGKREGPSTSLPTLPMREGSPLERP